MPAPYPTTLNTETTALAPKTNALDDLITAHGGYAFLETQSVKVTGRGEFTTPPQLGGMVVALSSFTYYIATGGRFRLEARSIGGPLLLVIRGEGRGGSVRLAGRNLDLSAEQTDDMEPTEYLRRAFRERYPVSTWTVEDVLRTESESSLSGYTIEGKRGRSAQAYIDSETGLLRKVVHKTSRGEIVVNLSDYQMVSGLPIFGEVLIQEDGANVFRLISDSIQINEPLPDRLFEV